MRLLRAFLMSADGARKMISRAVRPGLTLCLAVVLASPTLAQDSNARRAEGSLIKGSQEQPKVLYIVPWQLPTSPALDVPPPQAEVEGVLQPLERDFYRQSLYFRRHLKIGVLPDD